MCMCGNPFPQYQGTSRWIQDEHDVPCSVTKFESDTVTPVLFAEVNYHIVMLAEVNTR